MELLFEPFTFLNDANSRLYFSYLLSSLLIAVFVFAVLEKKRSAKALITALFAKKIWCNRSTLIDLGLLCANAWLKVLVFIPLFASAYTVAFYTVKSLGWLLPEAVSWELSKGTVAILYTAFLVLLLDLSRYAMHRVMHTNTFLWRFHRVHHSAETMTPLTLYRVHPVESMLQYLRDVAVTGLVTGAFFFAFGSGIDLVTVAGVNIARLIFNHAGANLRHSHVWLSFGPLEHIFISPAQHQVHHSSAPEHRDTNFGSQFSFWDKLFGSLYLTSKKENISFGLTSKGSDQPESTGQR